MEATSVILMLGTVTMLMLTYALIRGLCVSANVDYEISTFKSLPRDLRIVVASIGVLIAAIVVIGNVAGPPSARASKNQPLQSIKR